MSEIFKISQLGFGGFSDLRRANAEVKGLMASFIEVEIPI